MTAPKCIQCGKDCVPAIRYLSFLPAAANKRENGERNGNNIFLEREDRPRSKEELAKYTNLGVRKVWKDSDGYIQSANVWDGVTYVDRHFHSQTCAAAFGRKVASYGVRFDDQGINVSALFNI